MCENGGVSSSPLVAQFQLQPSDLSAFSRFASGSTGKKATPLQTLLVLFFAVLGATVIFYNTLHNVRTVRAAPVPSSGRPLLSVLGLVLPLVVFGAFWIFFIVANKKARANSRALQRECTVSLSEDDFRVEFGPTTIINRWPGVLRVGDTREHLFVFTQSSDGFVVPRRAFASDEEFERFFEFAHTRCEAAKPLVPPLARV